jgi:AcrR family transcriptional regulator
VLDATVECLVELGYAGTTTLEVQHRAGVSRGALLHHYTSRSELILAALEHLTEERIEGLHEAAERIAPGADRIAWAVRTLWGTVDDRLFAASLELWLAARSDPELRAALIPKERVVGRVMMEWATDLFGEAAEHPRFPAVLEVLIDAMRGAAARGVLRSPTSNRRLVDAWTDMVKALLGVRP